MPSPGEGERIDLSVDEVSLRQLLAVHRLTLALHEAESPAAFYDEALDAVVTTLGAHRAALLLFDPDGVMRFKAWRGLSNDYRQAVEGHTPWSPEDADAKPVVVPEAAADPDMARFMPAFEAEGIAALAFVPLVHHRRVAGKFMLYYDEAHEFSTAEVAVAEILAAQVALVLERRRMQDNERAARVEAEAAAARLAGIARTLQASLLPPRFPDIPGMAVAARYAAAGVGVDVGGDFYDLFPLDGGRFLLVLGDVCGRGVDAAALAAMTRHSIRSAAVTTIDPVAVLAHVNEVVLRSQATGSFEPRFCTAVVALIDPGGTDGPAVDLAVAGHPLPLVRRADGTVEPVGVLGTLLGVAPEVAVTASRIVLGPGEAFVCVTDGVLERRNDDVLFGDAAFGDLVAAGPDEAEALAAGIETAALRFAGERPSDDFAVIVVQADR